MINIVIGNIFESKMDVLVNTVNCVGVMGKGIASDFKKKYPAMFDEYKKLCDQHSLKTGTLYPYLENNKVKLVNFPTKQHWRSPSKLEYITEGLEWFVKHYAELNIKSIAFPPLGCGNGGLSWDQIGPIMYQYLKDLPIEIEIYAPFNTSRNKLTKEYLESNHYDNTQTTGIKYKKINDKWFLPLQIVKCLNNSEYDVLVGRIIFQKICFVLSRYGIDLGLKFVKGTYGPYSADIKEMITILSNNNYIYEKQVGKSICLSVTDQFKIDKSLYTKEETQIVNKVYSIFKGIRNASQAEILTTILFSYDELSKKYDNITENTLYNYIHEWKARHENFSDELKIRDFIKSLSFDEMIEIDYSKDFVDNYF
ncbi:type II toxin-antitoxin system antitoxin DNA ADP-ribosyl glycohydrolase DarG [Longibaculum muris]|uniref:type II toxin-antitoxin system antitoxin DNA ADP-ribosyl glycohydrolase DarG n=1 Tax=Longibaculum muris TaxID=1796628 RepID=UPI0022DF414F|nr:macro domain-containing protein [Longibaculum muris]